MDAVRALRRYTTGKPLMRWVPVLGADGHVRMEMRWQVSDKTAVVRDRTSVQAAA